MQKIQKHGFDKHFKYLPLLEEGDRISVQMGNCWKPVVVTEHADSGRNTKIL